MALSHLVKSDGYDHPTYKTRRDQKAGQVLTVDNWAGVENAVYTPFADEYVYGITLTTENDATDNITFTLIDISNNVETVLQQVTFLSTQLLMGTYLYIPVIPPVQSNEPLSNPNLTGVPILAGDLLWCYRTADPTWVGNCTFEVDVQPGANISAGRA